MKPISLESRNVLPSARLHTPDPPKQRSGFEPHSRTPSVFGSSPPVLSFLTPKLPKRRLSSLHSSRPFKRVPIIRPSSPIASSEGADALFLATCQTAENADREGLEGAPVDVQSEADENEAFVNQYSSSELSIETSDDNNEDDWGVDDSDSEPHSEKPTWIDSGTTVKAQQKLIRILKGKACIPQQRWSLLKILATLVHHRKHPALRVAYRQFRLFAYQTMMIETGKKGRWPGALPKNDFDSMIKHRLNTEFAKRCNKEVQNLCRIAGFGMMNETPGDIDRAPLETIVVQAKDQAPLLTDIILAVGPACNRTLSSSSSHLVNMKLVAVFVILCRTAHRNNSNYLPLLIALYLYSAGARVDAITLLNHLGLCVSYDVLQKKLRNITASSMSWIKQQSTNRKLIGTWDNFEYRENVYRERLGDTVKFRLVTMALWIENGWRIPATGLQQSM